VALCLIGPEEEGGAQEPASCRARSASREQPPGAARVAAGPRGAHQAARGERPQRACVTRRQEAAERKRQAEAAALKKQEEEARAARLAEEKKASGGCTHGRLGGPAHTRTKR
jgi:hypothetical protein